jgi:methionyl aminopeptidase
MSWTKSEKEIATLREIGKLHARILNDIETMVKPGISTLELDRYAEQEVRKAGATPAFLHYQPQGAHRPYPATLCVSVNDEIVHGIPSKDRILKEGDIVSCDLGVKQHGLITDAAITVAVGKVSHEVQTLMDATQEALRAGIEVCRAGNHIGDIGAAISGYIKPFKYGEIYELGGHGVGHKVHEEPFVPNMGKKGTGHELEPGMVLALEPMFSLGSSHIVLHDDGYTIATKDGAYSAHFEHTIAITEGDPIILTAK